jgi:hypothetical protein
MANYVDPWDACEHITEGLVAKVGEIIRDRDGKFWRITSERVAGIESYTRVVYGVIPSDAPKTNESSTQMAFVEKMPPDSDRFWGN